MRAFSTLTALVATLALAGCTVHKDEAPSPSGPSGLAQSITISANPDSISQDGGSQSSIRVVAIGPSGKAQSGLPLRVDTMVNGVAQDVGTLSARTIVTNADGVASVVFTAPPATPGGITGTCQSLPGTCVTVAVTPVGTGFDSAAPQTVSIRLVPIGVILPPAGTPTAAFTMSPTQALMNVPVTFDASNSTVGAGATQIASYAWNFGDGTQASGKSVTHTFTSQQTFNVTLTVTNDRGLSASTVTPVAVGALSAPAPKVVFSPTAPAVGQTIVFNADQSVAAAGHSIVTFNWNFGDGATGTGSVTTHAFSTAGTYNVVLSERDDTGQVGATTVAVTVTGAGAGGGGVTNASFSFSPLTPSAGQPIFFNAASSSAAAGHTLTTYAWDFGDGTNFAGSVTTATHSFTAAGTFTVTLTVTDDSGQKATTKTPITVASASAGSLSAGFTISPTNPPSGTLVTFNANTSSPLASITQFDWDFGDGVIVNNGGMIINHTFTNNTAVTLNYTVRLTVHDATGNTATTSNGVPVGAGADPIAQFAISPNPATLAQASTSGVSFDASASKDSLGGTSLTYQWDFGDGSALGTGKTPTHVYSATGTYTITLTVTQTTNGHTGTTSHTLIVQ